MAKVAAGHLYLTTKSGEVHRFAPGDALPSWAQRVIKNPAAMVEDGKSAVPAKAPAKPAAKTSGKKAESAKKQEPEPDGDESDPSETASDGAGTPEADSPEDVDENSGAEGEDADDEMSPVFDPKA